MAPDNDLEVQVFAGMRSGHHAIINWILSHFHGVTLFRNNVCGAEHFVYRGATDTEIERDASRRLPKECYLFNLEDRPMEEVVELLDERADHLAWGSSGRVVRILVLRDLYNFMASRLHGLRRIPAYISQDWPGLWGSHAREFLGLTQICPDTIKVSFNSWVSDLEYRKELARLLGLEFTDAGLERVMKIGAGSSFDGLRYDGRAQQMQVLRRWPAVADDPEYQELIADPELRDLSHQIFGSPREPLLEGAGAEIS